tara:strand:- start:12057 stop:12305 length:249 start_codon:yes stop_codon:yes gene_type:complete
MDNIKYTVSILDSKWVALKRNIKLGIIPRRDEYIFMDNQYWEVLNVVHMLNEKQEIFIVVTTMSEKKESEVPKVPENQEIKK